MSDYLPTRADAAERRGIIAREVVKYTRKRFGDDGTWFADFKLPGTRELVYYCFAFFEEGSDDSVRLANAILRRYVAGYRFCHFLSCVLHEALLHYESKMDPETVAVIEAYLAAHVDSFMGQGLDFVGVNDNFPCMSTAAVLFWGQRKGLPQYVEKARERLRQLRDLLHRRTFTSEYTSPTYTPIQALVLAEIANYAQDEEIRSLALFGEQRVLDDLLLHYHRETGQLAGAFSRGYAVDAAACAHHAVFIYYAIFGDALAVSPLKTVFACEEGLPGTIMHHGDGDFLKVSCMWQLLPDYHCPAVAWQAAQEKKYPFTVTGTNDMLGARESEFPSLPKPSVPMPPWYELPPRENVTTTYMTAAYALSTSRYTFNNGNPTHNLRILYRKRPEVREQRDVGTVGVRYVINDVPVDWVGGTYDDMGKRVTLQKGTTAAAIYFPRIANNEGLFSLKLTVYVAALLGDPEELRVGGSRVTESCDFPEAQTVYLKDGELCASFTPLSPEPMSMEIRREEKTWEISFVNYRGEPKDFPREALAKIANGVLVETSDCGDLDAFIAAGSPSVEDRYFSTVRRTRCVSGRHLLACEYAYYGQTVRFLTEKEL